MSTCPLIIRDLVDAFTRCDLPCEVYLTCGAQNKQQNNASFPMHASGVVPDGSYNGLVSGGGKHLTKTFSAARSILWNKAFLMSTADKAS